MDCNVNFKGRLIVDGITKNKNRWENIAKIFNEETKGINYESRIFDSSDKLEIYVDRMERKNRKYDYIEDLTTREAILTKKDSKELLSQSDKDIAKTLAKHLQFVKKLDESCKQASKMLDDSFDIMLKMFKKNGYNTEYVNKMFDNVYADEIGQSKVITEYKDLRELPGFKEATISHVDYIG